MAMRGGGGGGDGSLSSLESAARDAIARAMANPDVQNMADNIRSGALKVDGAFPCFFDLVLTVSPLVVGLPTADVGGEMKGDLAFHSPFFRPQSLVWTVIHTQG